MRPTVSQYARALEELQAEMKPHALVESLKGWLRRRGEEKKFPLILKALERRLLAEEKKLMVTAVTAHELDHSTEATIMKKAKELFPHQMIELESRIEKEVVGGVKLQTEEALYDATVRTSLKLLKNSLLKG